MTQLVLQQPLTLSSGTIIKNRFFKSAMNENFAKNGHPNQQHVNLYRTWANGGAGLLLTGNVMIDQHALGEPGNVVVEDERDLEVLKQWAEAGTVNNTQLWMQINHPGKQSPRTLSKEPVAPSAIGFDGIYGRAFNKPRALTQDEIKQTIQRFVNTAAIAKKAGFTGVEIHGAHGYLIDQFLSPLDNQRTDEYGGSLENRMRFLVEIYQGIRQTLGDDFPIGLKINSSDFQPGGFTEDNSLQVIKRMESLGINLIEISGGNYASPKMSTGTSKNSNDAFFINYAKKIKDLIHVPVGLTGGFRTQSSMENAVADGDTNMVGIGRPLVLLPDLPNRIFNGSYATVNLPWLTTGIKSLDKTIGPAIGNSYYEQQMARIANDEKPKISTNAWSPLFYSLRVQGLAALSPKRAK
ncbi:NADH:flavin oxidoreductase/NADH oxidase family protein [Lentilactobacillus kisonensis]|uniref:Oxidoreductase, FAD/FMN-binding protein n=2 Tax=Lentilactobacillus kisonensis TaxID=481722 RepID=H1LDS1_9LACO|nr:NADH:flavin oxidoreductase/NADH oxidase family protein [Lentilactobacillus kisonensis]EHO53042.1 oxidoreductase, FAD/FMN-binding protein [Lentilactobacillus kisonensis F0435]KRL22724.1 oxidoreductase, FAD FMN-binding protein [Lentilactobacillus kisonensis DSM 19906 = JCM 15041]